MDFYDRDIVSIRDFTREEIEYLLDLSEKMMPYATGDKTGRLLDGKILGNLFFEPSTRTKLSFESAACRLGCDVIDVSEMSMTRYPREKPWRTPSAWLTLTATS